MNCMRKLIPEIKNVYSSIHPLYVLCNWFGLSCYSDIGGSRQPYSVTWTSSIRCTVLLIGYYIGVYFSLESIPEKPSQGFLILVIIYHHYVSAVVSFIMAIVSIILSKNVVRILEDINKIDKKFLKYGFRIDYKRTYAIIIIGIFVIAFFTILAVICNIGVSIFQKAIGLRFLLSGFQYIPFGVKVVIEMNYFYCMDVIKRRFDSINGALEDIRRHVEITENAGSIKLIHVNEVKSIFFTENPKQHNDGKLLSLFDMISVAHLKLCDTALLLNRTFVIHLLILITCCFMGSVSALFLLVTYSYKANLETGNVMFTLWTCSNVAELVLIVYMACKTRDQSAVAARTFHRIRNSVAQRHLQESIEAYSMQMYHSRLQFSVCGLFPLDYTLLHTIIASITTYLIIMVQFRSINDNFQNVTSSML